MILFSNMIPATSLFVFINKFFNKASACWYGFFLTFIYGLICFLLENFMKFTGEDFLR